MAYADGELDDETAAAVEAFLAEDAGAHQKRVALGQMNDVVRSYLELAADDAEPRLDAMWATIERRIQANGVAAPASVAAARAGASAPVAASAARASAAQASDAARALDAARAGKTGLWARIGAWLEEYRGYFATGALAAAAAAVLVMALRPPQVVERVVVAPAPQDSPRNPPQMVNVSTPPEVEVLEVNDGSASVFTLPKEKEGDVTAGVIWLDLDSSQTEGPL